MQTKCERRWQIVFRSRLRKSYKCPKWEVKKERSMFVV